MSVTTTAVTLPQAPAEAVAGTTAAVTEATTDDTTRSGLPTQRSR
jgi:hypothetical protein